MVAVQEPLRRSGGATNPACSGDAPRIADRPGAWHQARSGSVHPALRRRCLSRDPAEASRPKPQLAQIGQHHRR